MKTLPVPVILMVFALLGCAAADDGEPQRNADRAPAGRTDDQTGSLTSMKVISRGSYGKQARDIDSGRGEAPFVEVARDQSSLTRLWDRYIAEGEQPEVSFDRSLVVFLLLPPRPTGGYGIEPKDAVLSGRTLELNASLREPGQRDIVTQAFTAPYAVVRIEGLDTEVENVVWKDEGRTVAKKSVE